MKLVELDVSAGVALAFEVIQARKRGLTLFTGPTGSGKSFAANLLLESMREKAEALPTSRSQRIEPRASASDVFDAGDLRDDASVQTACNLASRINVVGVLRSSESIFAIERLSDMGCQTNELAATDPIIVTQRLCGRLCIRCRRPRPCTSSEKQLLHTAGQLLWTASEFTYDKVGCDQCADGFLGSVALFEVVRVGVSGSTASERERWSSLLGEGILKVLGGSTTIAELERVIPGWALSNTAA